MVFININQSASKSKFNFIFFDAMCYNYSNHVQYEGGLINKYKLRISERQALSKEFADKYGFYYKNGFDYPALPIITSEQSEEVQFYHWGLIPHWVKDMKEAQDIRTRCLNARSETVFEKNSFKKSIWARRCLVPATGFYEWRHVNGKKYPYLVQVRNNDFPDDSQPFHFGGIYDQWTDKGTGEVFNTFAIITTPANELLEIIHNSTKRMPLIIPADKEELWLSPTLGDTEIEEIMQPYPSNNMIAFTISKRITNRKLDPNVPELLEHFKFEELSDDESLFE